MNMRRADQREFNRHMSLLIPLRRDRHRAGF
jgi:hypothetical protein